jgi:hypothetical protein
MSVSQPPPSSPAGRTENISRSRCIMHAHNSNAKASRSLSTVLSDPPATFSVPGNRRNTRPPCTRQRAMLDARNGQRISAGFDRSIYPEVPSLNLKLLKGRQYMPERLRPCRPPRLALHRRARGRRSFRPVSARLAGTAARKAPPRFAPRDASVGRHLAHGELRSWTGRTHRHQMGFGLIFFFLCRV